MKQLCCCLIILVLFISGCARQIPSMAERTRTIDKISESNNAISKQIYNTPQFNHFGIETNLNNCKNQAVSVYIEGDGLSWVTTSLISKNPTPINPVGFKLMMKDESLCRVYIARPCQYVSTHRCNNMYWTSHRFSQEVLDSFHTILDSLKVKYQINRFSLYGYSGGGAIATLLSADRSDVDKLVTVAGNLDIAEWIKHHTLTPLSGSLNPADQSESLADIRQFHFIGELDENIGKFVFMSYLNRFDDKKNVKYKVVKGLGHYGWPEKWDALLKEIYFEKG